MDKEIQVWLFDILNSILEIESFVDFEETNFQDYS